jgi:hypothetical protein
MLVGPSRGYDPDNYFVRFVVGVRHKQQQYAIFGIPYGLPTTIFVNPALQQWIVKNRNCRFKVDSVLYLVDPILVLIPLEDHATPTLCTYNYVNTTTIFSHKKGRCIQRPFSNLLQILLYPLHHLNHILAMAEGRQPEVPFTARAETADRVPTTLHPLRELSKKEKITLAPAATELE